MNLSCFSTRCGIEVSEMGFLDYEMPFSSNEDKILTLLYSEEKGAAFA
jgi:hypothetical protein